MAEVLIGCKLPNGIILELVPLPDPDRTKQTLQPAPTGQRVELAGSNSKRAHPQKSQATHVYATTSVDKAFWDAWIARPQNKELAFIKNGQVFLVEGAGKDRDFKAMAKERDNDVQTGMEPLAQKGDPRLPQGKAPGTSVEADPESLKARGGEPRAV